MLRRTFDRTLKAWTDTISVFWTNDAREPSGNLRALEVELSVVTLVRIARGAMNLNH